MNDWRCVGDGWEPLFPVGPMVGRLTHRDFAWYWYVRMCVLDDVRTHVDRMRSRRNNTNVEFRRQWSVVTDAARHPLALTNRERTYHVASLHVVDHVFAVLAMTRPSDGTSPVGHMEQLNRCRVWIADWLDKYGDPESKYRDMEI